MKTHGMDGCLCVLGLKCLGNSGYIGLRKTKVSEM